MTTEKRENDDELALPAAKKRLTNSRSTVSVSGDAGPSETRVPHPSNGSTSNPTNRPPSPFLLEQLEALHSIANVGQPSHGSDGHRGQVRSPIQPRPPPAAPSPMEDDDFFELLQPSEPEANDPALAISGAMELFQISNPKANPAAPELPVSPAPPAPPPSLSSPHHDPNNGHAANAPGASSRAPDRPPAQAPQPPPPNPHQPVFVQRANDLTATLPPDWADNVDQARQSQSLKQFDEFAPFNFSYNESFNSLICDTCQSVVPSDTALSHSQTCDGTFALKRGAANSTFEPRANPPPRTFTNKPTLDQERAFAAKWKSLGCISLAAQLAMRRIDTGHGTYYIPIHGVRIIENYYGCCCGGGSVPTQDGWRGHTRKEGQHKKSERCWVQRPINNANGTYYRVFPVLPAQGNLTDHELLDLYHRKRMESYDPSVNTSLGLRYTSLFTHFSGLDIWARRNKLTRSLLSALHQRTLAPTRDPVLSLVSHHVRSYVNDIVHRFDGSDKLIRKDIQAGRILSSTGSDATDLEQLQAHESPTRQKYSRSIVRLVCYALRTADLRSTDAPPADQPFNQHEDPSGPPDTQPEDFLDQEEALDALDSDEQDADAGDATSDVGAMARAKNFGQLTSRQMAACKAYYDLLRSTDASQTPSSRVLRTDVRAPGVDPRSRPQPVERSPYKNDEVHRALHELLLSIIEQDSPADCMQSIGISFLVLASATKAGSWSTGLLTAAIISSLKWGFRLAVYRQATFDQNHTMTDWRNSLKPHIGYVSSNNPCTFEWMANLGAELARIHAGAFILPSTMLYDNKLWLRGEVVQFPKIIEFVHKIRNGLFDGIRDLLGELGASELLEFDWRSNPIRDEWNAPQSRYTFLTDPKNEQHWPPESYLWQKLVDSRRFHVRAEHILQWDRPQATKLLHKLQRIALYLMATIHLTAGGTSRAAEVSGQFRRNANRQRSILWMFGRCIFHPAYHKGSHSMHDKDAFVRAADWNVSVICIIYWRYCTYLQWRIWLDIFKCPDDVAEQFLDHLYWNGKRLINADDLGRLFRAVSMTIFGFEIGILDWRHLAIVLQQAEIATARNSKLINHLYDVHSGHTTYTQERHYSINAEPTEELSYGTILQYVILSVAQHKLFRVDVGPEDQLIAGNRIEGVSVDGVHPLDDRAQSVVVAHPRPTTHNTPAEIDPQRLANLFRDVLKPFQDTLIQDSNRVQDMLCELNGLLHHDKATLDWNRPVNIDSNRLRHALVSETNGKMQEFKSREQAEAVHLSLQPQKNIGLFLRTGAGKTLATQLCMSQYFGNPLSILIYAVPYIALQRNIIERAQAMYTTIRVGEWRDYMTPGTAMPNVVVVVYETLVEEHFLTWCQRHKEFISRIVLDEAHVLVVDAAWRTTLRKIACVQVIGAPLTVLAGIITPRLITELERVLKSTMPFHSIGQAPERREIRYTAQFLECPSPVFVPKGEEFDADPIVAVIKAQIERVREMGPQHRLMAYVQSTSLADLLGQLLGAPVCHAQKDWTRDDPIGEWFAGTQRPNSILIICTDVLGAGFDAPHIRVVMHFDLPNHMIAYLQQTGRAGRDGDPAEAILFHPPKQSIEWRLGRRISDTYSIDHHTADRLGGMQELYDLIYGSRCFQEAFGAFVGDGQADCFARCLPIHCSRCDPNGRTWETTPGHSKLQPIVRELPEPEAVTSVAGAPQPNVSSSSKKPQWVPKPRKDRNAPDASVPDYPEPTESAAPTGTIPARGTVPSRGSPPPSSRPPRTVSRAQPRQRDPPLQAPPPSRVESPARAPSPGSDARARRGVVLTRGSPPPGTRVPRFALQQQPRVVPAPQPRDSPTPLPSTAGRGGRGGRGGRATRGGRGGAPPARTCAVPYQSDTGPGPSRATARSNHPRHQSDTVNQLAGPSTAPAFPNDPPGSPDQRRYRHARRDATVRLDNFKSAVLRLRKDICLFCWMLYSYPEVTHLWRPASTENGCAYSVDWRPTLNDPHPCQFREPPGSDGPFRLAPPHGCWGCDMPMNLHHTKTCTDAQVHDDYKDVILPAVGFAWHVNRPRLLSLLNLDQQMQFHDFRFWCMQPISFDHFVGSWSNVHLAFEVAVSIDNLLSNPN